MTRLILADYLANQGAIWIERLCMRSILSMMESEADLALQNG